MTLPSGTVKAEVRPSVTAKALLWSIVSGVFAPLSIIALSGVLAMTAHAQEEDLITVEEALAWPQPQPDEIIRYGEDPNQFGELRVPKGAGPHPLAIVVHGGGWEHQYDIGYITRFASALRDAGIATWSIEYRRANTPGGGWPGTLRDVAAAADAVRGFGARANIDLDRVIAIGHSAGGHLALWLAGRHKISVNREIVSPDPLPLIGVMGIAPVNDLRGWYDHPVLRVCEADGTCTPTVKLLMGGTAQEFPGRYRETNPREMFPLGVPQVIVLGGQDIWSKDRYYEAAKQAGENVELMMFDNAGHFELIDPDSAPWEDVVAAVRKLAGCSP